MHGRSWTEFYILITNCPNIATSLANIATSFVGMKDVAMLAKDVAMLGRTLLHVKLLIATEKEICAKVICLFKPFFNFSLFYTFLFIFSPSRL